MSSINKDNPENKYNPEFQTTMLSDPKTRRGALKSIGSGMTVAALSGCVTIRKPTKKIKTYNDEPEQLIPGEPNYYASSFDINGNVSGVVVTSYEGRPTKIDGNPRHPNNNGASSGYVQSEIHQLYDPDRLKYHLMDGKQASFNTIALALKQLKKDKSLAIVLPETASIIHRNLLSKIKTQYPKINLYYVSPVNSDKQISAIKHSTGKPGYFDYNFKKASLIINFNHDFLGNESSRLTSLKDYIDAQDKFQRISFSDSLTVSDSKADAIVKSTILEQEHIISYIAKSLAKKYGATYFTRSLKNLNFDKGQFDMEKAKEILSLLIKHRSKAIVSVGEIHSERIHRIVLLINALLKNVHRTVNIYPFSAHNTSYLTQSTFEASIEDLESKLSNGSISSIVSLDVDLTRYLSNASETLNKVNIYSLSPYENKLTKRSKAVLSKTHPLENWDILISKEGHLSIQQPLINPLYKSKSISDILLLLYNGKTDSYAYLRRILTQKNISFNVLKRYGVIKRKTKKTSMMIDSINFSTTSKTAEKNLSLSIIPSYKMLDGRYSNNSWLQESPDPISKLTWGNAFYIGHNFAKEHSLITGDVIRVHTEKKDVLKGPVVILPGQHDLTLTLSYGYGTIFNTTFSHYGISTERLIPNQSYTIKSIQKTQETEVLADTQMNHGMDEESLAASGIKSRIKNILQIKTIDEINTPHHKSHHVHSLFKELTYDGEYQWGMSIDLNACLGCGSCSIACQAENNIPIVGKKEVQKGREMSWLRIDRYFIENEANETTINFMPVACLHCENAPCEQVCPVNATVHDDEGLNVMTYNRCIGTRYCANNCPYKVRRFNFFDWHQKNPQSVKKERIHLFDYFREPTKTQQMQFNPEVTVRMRGVMEKCTFCIQRLKTAKIKTKVNNDDNYIKNIQTACQQACATGAITFGNINDRESLVSKKRQSKRRYDLLQPELNTKPRTIYLAKIKKSVWQSSPKKVSSYGHH